MNRNSGYRGANKKTVDLRRAAGVLLLGVMLTCVGCRNEIRAEDLREHEEGGLIYDTESMIWEEAGEFSIWEGEDDNFDAEEDVSSYENISEASEEEEDVLDYDEYDVTAELSVEPGGLIHPSDGRRYCRSDNCRFAFHIETNADRAYCRIALDGILYIEELLTGAEDENEEETVSSDDGRIVRDFQLTEEELVEFLEDGEHILAVTVENSEEILAEYTCSFVLDTAPPVISAEAVTAASRFEPTDGRVYLDADLQVRFSLEEENCDREELYVRRDCAEVPVTDNRSAVISQSGEKLLFTEDLITDCVADDGVFSYSIFGADKAGNAPVISEKVTDIFGEDTVEKRSESVYREGLFADSRTTIVFVRDTEKPAAEITVEAEGTVIYSQNEKGTVSIYEDYPGGVDPVVKVSAGKTEASPVRITGRVRYSDGQLRLEEVEGETKDGTVLRPENGEACYETGLVRRTEIAHGNSFRVTEVVIEDLAGNVTIVPDSDLIREETTKGSGSDEKTEEDGGAVREDTYGDETEESSEEPAEESATENEAESNAADSPDFYISYVNNDVRSEKYFRRERTAYIRVRRGSADLSGVRIYAEGGSIGRGWEEEEGYFTKTVVFREDGTCRLSVYITDSFGNPVGPQEIRGAAGEEFVIDQKKPQIAFSGVKNRSSNGAVPEVAVLVTDKYLKPESMVLKIASETEGEKEIDFEREETEEGFLLRPVLPEEDNYYRLICLCEDLAGNTSRKQIAYALNKNGTVFELLQKNVRGSYHQRPVRPGIVLHDMDEVQVLSAAVNGIEAEISREGNTLYFENLPETDGKYILTLSTRDSAGHVSFMDPIIYYIDTVPPVLTFEFSEGKQISSSPVKVRLKSSEDGAVPATVLLDGEEAEAREEDGIWTVQVDAAGEHRLAASLRDRAGNVGSEEVCTVTVREENGLRNFFGKCGWIFLAVAGVAAAAGYISSGKCRQICRMIGRRRP